MTLNSVFAHQPHRVLGQLTTRLGRFGPELEVTPPTAAPGHSVADTVAVDLERRLVDDLTRYAAVRPVFTPAPTPGPARRTLRTTKRPTTPTVSPGQGPPLVLPEAVLRAEGHLTQDHDGGWVSVRDGVTERVEVPKTQAAELGLLIELRDIVTVLLDTEATTPLPQDTPTGGSQGDAGEAKMVALRERLNRCYDTYLARYGPINRITTRNTGRLNPQTGEPILAQVRPPQGGFRSDPHSPAVFALEHYDSATGTATKADIFTNRVVAPRETRTSADTPADAVALCLDTYGELRPSVIARLLGVDLAQAETELEPFAYLTPAADPQETGTWIPSAEFLSGNVRAKLTTITAALAETPLDPTDQATATTARRFQAAAQALTEVLPQDLVPAEIVAQLGVAWIPAQTVEQFLTEILDDQTVEVEHPGGSVWTVRGNHHTLAAHNTWGTEHASAISIAQTCLEQRQIQVTNTTIDGRPVLNETATIAAIEKSEALQERFAEWLWEDPDRCQYLVRAYNDTFNSIVLRTYDDINPHKRYVMNRSSVRFR